MRDEDNSSHLCPTNIAAKPLFLGSDTVWLFLGDFERPSSAFAEVNNNYKYCSGGRQKTDSIVLGTNLVLVSSPDTPGMMHPGLRDVFGPVWLVPCRVACKFLTSLLPSMPSL